MVTTAVSGSRRQPENKEPVPSSSTEQEGEEHSISSEGQEDASGEIPLPNPNPNNGSDSDSDLGSPSDYMLQPIVPRKRVDQESESQPPAAKKSKTAAAAAGPSNPSGCIVRLWSGEDEVTLLNEIIDYNNSTGRSFNADFGAFFSHMQGKLQMDFKKDQLATKIRRLKKRFSDALNKSLVFSKPHDAKVFELCDKIWGAAVGNVNSSVAAVESDEKENHHGKALKKKKGKAVKELAVDVESDEKENNAGKSDKKKRKAVKELAVDVESDEMEYHHGKALKKGKAVKELDFNVESEEKENDAGKGHKKKAKAIKKRTDKVEMVDQKKSDAGTSVQKQEVGVIELDEKKEEDEEEERVGPGEKESDARKSDKKKAKTLTKSADKVEMDDQKKLDADTSVQKQDVGVIELEEKKEEDEEEKVGSGEKENNAGKIDKKKAKTLTKSADMVEMSDQKKLDAGTSVQNQEVGRNELDEKKEDEEEKVGSREKKNDAEKSDKKKAKTLTKRADKVEMNDQKKLDAGTRVQNQEVGVNELDEKKEDEKEKVGEEKGVDFQSKYPFLSDSFSSLSSPIFSMFMPGSLMNLALKRLSLIGDGKAQELDDKWQELAWEEMALNQKKLTLMMEQVSMCFDH